MLNIIRELEGKTNTDRKEIISMILQSLNISHLMHPYQAEVGSDVIQGHNIIVPSEKLTTIAISAHYDSIPKSPGANDNASGVAVMIDLMKKLRKNPLENLGIEYFFFGDEENDKIGSSEYVRTVNSLNFKGLYNLDSVGIGDRVMLWGAPKKEYYQILMQDIAYKKGMLFSSDIEMINGGSDHESFTNTGVNAFTLTTWSREDLNYYHKVCREYDSSLQNAFMKYDVDQEKLDEEKYRLCEILNQRFVDADTPVFKNYHKPSDTSKTIQPKTLEMVSDLLYSTLMYLDMEICSPAWLKTG